MITWRDSGWIEVGARVILTERPRGEFISGHPIAGDPSRVALLMGGARGIVVESPSGGAPAHACPNHELGEDECLCARPSGVLPARLPTAVVEWELDDGSVLRRLLRFPGTGGRTWERAPDSAWARPSTPTEDQ
jgi:hypothetical protein